MPKEPEARTFQFSDRSGDHTVKVWCDGRVYDETTEAYRPVYSYSITTPEWEFVSNDLHGAANEIPNVNAASQSLFAFLYSCQQGMPKSGGGFERNQSDTADLFPPHVREWAYLFAEQIELLYGDLYREGAKKTK